MYISPRALEAALAAISVQEHRDVDPLDVVDAFGASQQPEPRSEHLQIERRHDRGVEAFDVLPHGEQTH